MRICPIYQSTLHRVFSSTCGSVRDLAINIHFRPKFSHFELSSSFCNLNNMGKICKIWKNKPILHMKLNREWCVLERFGTFCYFMLLFETIWTFLECFGTFCYSMLLYETNWNNLNVLEWTFWNVFGMFWNFLLFYVTFWNDLIPKCSVIVVTATTYKLLEPSRQAHG